MTNERDLISFFYVGKNGIDDKYLMPKIGETKQLLKNRERDIRAHHAEDKNFCMIGALMLINATQAERRYIESYVRFKMEKYGKNIKNDHFLIRARAKKYREMQYVAFAIVALSYAIECCEKEHFLYVKKVFTSVDK